MRSLCPWGCLSDERKQGTNLTLNWKVGVPSRCLWEDVHIRAMKSRKEGVRTGTRTGLGLTRTRWEPQETYSLLCGTQWSATHDINMGPHFSNGIEEGGLPARHRPKPPLLVNVRWVRVPGDLPKRTAWVSSNKTWDQVAIRGLPKGT